MSGIFRVVVVAFGLAIAPAQAAFHLWTMNELYSNADGSVQFLELTALSGGQQFLSGHQLRATGASGGQRTFTFPGNLPGDTAGKRMLIGTQGFAALGIVAPDYVVPDGFFFRNGGAVDFAGVDDWDHGPLPVDGSSIDRSGTPRVNSPTNFAGQTGRVPVSNPAPGPNYQGLWYRGEVERGWGVNVAHQGDTLFVTWFTYDADGSQMWLVGPAVVQTSAGTYTGDLFRTSGPSFASFDPSQLTFVAVGSVTLAFTDLDNGTFTYTVGGATQSKPIVRQVFSTVPTCTTGGDHGPSPNFQDLWYRSPAESERGWGVNLTHQGDNLFVTWFTYDTSGRGMWLVGSNVARTSGNTFSGALFRTRGPAFNAVPWDPAGLSFTLAGTATFSFGDPDNGIFTYTVDGVAQSKAITRQRFDAPTVCR